MMFKLSYKYYVLNSDIKIVSGFNKEQDAVKCADKFRYKVYSFNNLKNKCIDPENIENWSFAFFNANINNKTNN